MADPITTPQEALDDDLIRRGDALEAVFKHGSGDLHDEWISAAIRALAPRIAAPVAPSTPAAKWRVEGQPDPHGTSYDCDRAKLTKGHLTDDELANGIFMADRNSLDLIVWQDAAKDRIRWLSRALEKALTIQPAAPVDLDARIAEAVAGAYAAAADLMGELAGQHKGNTAEIIKACGRAILMRKLTPADAAAALARRDAETRAKALREALKRISALARGASVETVQGQEQAYNAVLALIEEPAHG